MRDLFDSNKTTLVYEKNFTANFDQSPLHVFHMRKIMSSEQDRMYLFFEDPSGILKWIWFAGENTIA